MREEFPTAAGNEKSPRGRPLAITLDDLLHLFLTKTRLGTPYYALAKQFGVSNGSCQDLIIRVRDVFNKTVGRRLFYVQHASEVRENLPDDWPARFEDTLLIGDGYPKSINKCGCFVIQRITWSPYKHDNVFLFVICMISFLVLVLIALFLTRFSNFSRWSNSNAISCVWRPVC